MKKTLALALVAAMTISMASMTAFAKDVKYTDETDEWPEKSVATVTLKKEDCTETKIPLYKATKAVAASPSSYATNDEIPEDVYDKLGSDLKAGFKKTDETKSIYKIKFGDLKLKTFSNTATKTFFGWAPTDSADTAKSAAQWATNSDPTEKKNVLKDDKEITVEFTGDTATLYFLTVGRTDTTDEAIAKNLEEIEKKKNDGDAAKTEEDRLAELDKKYNADGKNAYDAEKKDVKGEVDKTRKPWTADNMNDYFHHAAKVAGAPAGEKDDGTKTWVYDISMKNGQKLYDGKNQRVSIALDGVSKDADLSKFGVKVYHVEGWCKATQVKNVDVKGNTVTFWASDFSPYVITLGDGVASTGADASNPSTGDFSAVPVALLAAAALGATGFVAYKKRKAE